MKVFFLIASLLCLSRNVLGNRSYYQNYVSYDDLLYINASCYPVDSCTGERNDDSPEVPDGNSCSCHRQCWQLDTCCIDSDYRNYAPPTHSCRPDGTFYSVNGVYMVDNCPVNTAINSIWKSLCEKEWNGEDDILMLSPVTSLGTSTTYKNFYCLKCHETTDKFISWNLYVQGYYENPDDRSKNSNTNYDSKYSVAYDQAKMSWMATMDDNSVSIPVNLSFQFPHLQNLQMKPMDCNLRMVSNCPDTCTDEYLLHTCRAYTAVVYSNYNAFLTYRNAHCALCNGESLDNVSCQRTVAAGFGGVAFDFQRLLDLNQDDKNKVGQEGKCEEDHVWDPYGEKCRKIKCALPGYKVKNGSCTPP